MTSYTLAKCTKSSVHMGICNAETLEAAERIAEDLSFFEMNMWMVFEESSEEGLKIISKWLCGNKLELED